MKKSLRYVMPVGVEVEYEPGSRNTVLRNLVGIKRKQEIEQAGYPIPNYGFTGKGGKKSQKAYLYGVQQGYIRNYQPLADFFADSLKGD